jgi:hypothetical protein
MPHTSRWIVAAALGLTLTGCATSGSGSPVAEGSSGSQPPGTVQASPTGTNATLSTTPPDRPSEGGSPPRAAGVVTISRTGGIAGVNEMVQVAPDGTWVFHNRKSGESQQGKLTSAQHDELNRLIAAPGFAAEARQRPPTGVCNDGFVYTVVAGDISAHYTQCSSSGNQTAIKAVVNLVVGATPM